MRAEITNFWALILNPSSVHRLVHVWLAAFILGSFFIMSVSAWYLLRRRHQEFARRSFEGALLLATVSSLAVAVSGHYQADNVYRHQPAKLAAMEAHFRTGPGDLSLFGLPDEANERIDFGISVPGALSFLLEGDPAAPVLGLDRFRPQDRPPVAVPFVSYHLMVVFGMFFIGITALASILRWRGALFGRRWLLWVFVFAVLPAVAANQLGWAAAEVGRQPWVVQPPVVRGPDGEPALDPDGFVRYETVRVTLPDGTVAERTAGLRTEHGVSEAVSAGEVLTSIILFGIIYVLLGVIWVFLLNRKIQEGPGGKHPAHRGLLDAAGALAGRDETLTGPREA